MTQDNNSRDIQEIISWIEKKSPEPWEVLYRVVTDNSNLVHIKVNPLLHIKWGVLEAGKAFWNDIWQKSGYKVPVEEQGGELLTRLPNPIIISASEAAGISETSFIGRAFGGMPSDKMDAVLFSLVKRQLQYVNGKLPKKYFSINLEAPVTNNIAWQDICQLFLDKGNEKVSIELIERKKFPLFSQYDLANVCRDAETKISLDDLGSGIHDLGTPEGEVYLREIITVLGEYLTTFKMDYDIVRNMSNNLDAVGQVGYNLTAVAWLWMYCAGGRKMPSVTFESMPRQDRHWLLAIQKICSLFNGVLWQVE